VVNLGKFRRPHGIDIDHQSNRLAVSTELPDQLLIIDPVKRAIVRTLDTKGKTSHIVKFGAGAKWAYVSNSNSANVSAIHMETGAVTLIPAGMRPEGSVLSRDSRELYVCNREGASITVIDTAKNAVTGQIRTGKGPVRVDITPDSRYLVYALIHENKVEIADLAARKAVAQVPLGGSPVSLHLSPDGKFAFAAAQDRDTVYVVSVPERKLVREFKTAAGAGPDPVMQIR
jgi:YVTN family beta-propeller protein